MTNQRKPAGKGLKMLIKKLGLSLGVTKPDDPIADETERRSEVMEEMMARVRARNRVNRLRIYRDALIKIREARRET